jgi:hypothetical protein
MYFRKDNQLMISIAETKCTLSTRKDLPTTKDNHLLIVLHATKRKIYVSYAHAKALCYLQVTTLLWGYLQITTLLNTQ